ncbi:hypothetical protein BR93DRAFT_980851 [Coniochaeta sp. PMI_546]|nr:hypothetical protein BR93DRAFT_980851 [Coniochaeta sp. PMI_546]
MTRGTIPSGFQLVLPDSEQFNVSAQKVQNDQESNTQQQKDHANGQHHNNRSPATAANTQGTTPPGSDNGQQHQQLQMHDNNHHTNQPPQVNSPNQQRHQGTTYQSNDFNQQHVQPAQGQALMSSINPGAHNKQYQTMLALNNQNIEEATLGYNSNNQQHAGSVQPQNMMVQAPMDQHFMPQGVMHTNNYNNQWAAQGTHASNQHDIQTNHVHNMLASGSLNAQQHHQSFVTHNNAEQFPQNSTGIPMFNQQHQGMLMPGNSPCFPNSRGNMFSNDIIGHQGTVGTVSGMEQFQHPPGFPTMVENCVRQMLEGSTQLQMVNKMGSMQQQPGVPVTPTPAQNQAGNQSVAQSLGA